jgi:glyoxylate/hydroxypyruvate reductase A
VKQGAGMPCILFQSETDDPAPWREALTRALPGLDFRVWPRAGRLDEIGYALVWKPPPGMLRGLPRLKAILSLGAGVDHIFSDPQLPPGVSITRMVDAGLAVQMTEYALYGLLHFHRYMHRYAEQQRAGEWRQLPAVTPQARTVGVMGLGVLGADFARKAAALGFRVLGWSRSPRQLDGVEAYAGRDALEAFLARVEVLVNFLPLTPETRGILDARAFARLARGAFLINLARGEHVVESDLLAALDSGQLGGALLDVFGAEPLPAGHPFWRHPRVVITPHIAGQAIAELMVEQVVGNIQRIERGEAPLGLVQPDRGY